MEELESETGIAAVLQRHWYVIARRQSRRTLDRAQLRCNDSLMGRGKQMMRCMKVILQTSNI